MRRFKKLTSAVLIAAMAISMVGCGGKEVTTEPEVTTEEVTEEVTTEEVTTEEEVVGNMIINGDFSDGTNHFDTYTNGGSCTIGVKGGELSVDIGKIGPVGHGVQLFYDGFEMKEGALYDFSFDIHGTVERDIEWRIQINGGDYHAYCSDVVHVTEEVQHISTQFTMEEASDPAPRLCFNMGYVDSMAEAGIDAASFEAHSIMFDNLDLELVDSSNVVAQESAVEVPKVKVNQIGYYKSDVKTAVFSDLDAEDNTFTVVNVDSGESVFEGTMTERVQNRDAGEENCSGDFTNVQEEGTYKIVTGKGEESVPFKIGDKVYGDSFKSIVKMLYMQRCGQELTSDLAGDFAHPECHTGEATIYGTDTKIDVTGGWHDAGDYGRYVSPAAKAVADLLLAYEKNPEAFGDDCGTCDSGDGVNDALQEAKYELDWMLKMQDAETGGVYHKVTCKAFPETVMPQDETDELVVCPLSKTASADFAAVMAMASRVYTASGDAAYGKTCLEAAEKAWAYYVEHKDERGFKNPIDVDTGEYADGSSREEYFWAAAELYKTTENPDYKDAMASALEETLGNVDNLGGLGWMDVSAYGAYAALTTDALNADSTNLRKDIENAFFAAVEDVVAIAKKNSYMVSREKNYEWGSNMGIANNGMLLMLANEIHPDETYLTYAKAQLNYLLGVNATGYCFVTGEGTLSPEHPHHRPSEFVGKCVPGMLVGGPDSALEDPFAKAVFTDTPAAKCYADNAQSYSCNEITIYWNSPLIYLMVATEE